MGSFKSFINTKMKRFFLLLLPFTLSSCDKLTDYECEPSDTGYIVPDPHQCDRYAICSEDGIKQILLCEDGLAFHDRRGVCAPLSEVDCAFRRTLQDPNVEPGSPCQRLNGNFPYIKTAEDDTNECTHYYRCVNGIPKKNYCPAGTVFDFEALQCVHTERSGREECKASTILDFKCPEVKTPFSKKLSPLFMRFGGHDRLPHPEDCSKFYVCLPNGQPLLSSCPVPDVFNPATGFCERYDTVDECMDFYSGEALSMKISKIK